MARGAVVGALRVVLGMRSAAFDKGANAAEKRMGRFHARMQGFQRRIGGIGRRLSIGITAPMAAAAGAALRSSLSVVDAQAKMAQSMDTTVVSIQNLTRASELAGISQNDLEGSLRRMTRRVSLAESGTGPAVKALGRLNIAAADLAGLPVDERVNKLVTAIKTLIPEAQQAGVASEIFGDKTGLAMLRLDPETLARAAREVKEFGVAVADVDADQIEAANDAMSALGLVTRGLANQLSVALAPTLQFLAEKGAELSRRFAALSPETRRLIGIGAAVAAALGPVAIGLGFVAAGLAALASPIGVVILGLGAVAGVAALVAAKWDGLVERFPALGEVATRSGNAISAAWEGSKDQFSALVSVLTEGVRSIGALFRGDLQGALENFKGMFSGLGRFFRATVDTWLGILESLLPGSREALTSVVNGITEFFSGLPAELERIGGQIIEGLKRGILEKWESVKSSIKDVFDFVPQSAREVLETRSPSRVFIRIGRDLMDGLGIGIQERTQVAVDALQQGVDQMSGSLDGLGDSADQTSRRFGDMVAGLVTGSQTIGGALSSLGTRLASSGISGLAGALFEGSGLGDLFAGFFDRGGTIPRGQFGVAAERGNELVNGVLVPGPAQVTSRAETARMLSGGSGGVTRLLIEPSEMFRVVATETARGVSVDVMGEGLSEFSRNTLPDRVEQINSDPWRRG
jgi:hypothetical protein